MKDLGPRATSCLAYHPQASKFAGCKSILFNLEKKRKNLFIAELEWSLDDKDTANVMEARSVLDSLDIDNDLEVFHFKVSFELWIVYLSFQDFGKDFIKSCRCSPDSWIQVR